MATVSERLRGGFASAKTQLDGIHERAVSSMSDVREQVSDVPEQLKGAWERVIHRICLALPVPTREDLEQILARLDGIEERLSRLEPPARQTAAKRSRKK